MGLGVRGQDHVLRAGSDPAGMLHPGLALRHASTPMPGGAQYLETDVVVANISLYQYYYSVRSPVHQTDDV